MERVGAVNIVQGMGGRIACVIAELDATTELLHPGPVPQGDITAVYSIGVDIIKRQPTTLPCNLLQVRATAQCSQEARRCGDGSPSW